MDWINAVVQGVMVGGLYALFAAGLSLAFGIMRLVNIAHGDFIVLGGYLGLVVVTTLGLHPLASIVIVVPLMFALGYVLQRYLLNQTLGKDILPPLLVTFGLSIVVQNVLLEVFSADSQKLSVGALETMSLSVGGLGIGVFPLMTFALAVAVIWGLQFVFYKTRLGMLFRAASDDPSTLGLMGVDNRRIYALALGVAFAVVALAGVLMASRTNFDPTIGPARLLFAFEAVIIGGLGSLWGTLIGGIILGVAQAIGATINPGYQILAGHLVFLAVLIIRPRGLFPRSVD